MKGRLGYCQNVQIRKVSNNDWVYFEGFFDHKAELGMISLPYLTLRISKNLNF